MTLCFAFLFILYEELECVGVFLSIFPFHFFLVFLLFFFPGVLVFGAVVLSSVS